MSKWQVVVERVSGWARQRAYEDLVEVKGLDVKNLGEIDHALVHGNDLHGGVDLRQSLPDRLLALGVDQVQLRQKNPVGEAHLLNRLIFHTWCRVSRVWARMCVVSIDA